MRAKGAGHTGPRLLPISRIMGPCNRGIHQGSIGSIPKKFDWPNRRKNGGKRGKWGGGGAMGKTGGETGGNGGKWERGGGGWGNPLHRITLPTSPTNLAHINTNIPGILVLGGLVLGKSLTCGPRLVVSLGGRDKRNFDTPNILMLQKISNCLHKVTGESSSRQQQADRKSSIQIYPFFPVFACQLLALSRFPS